MGPKIKVYTDGSYNVRESNIVFGGYVVLISTDSGDKPLWGRRVYTTNTAWTSMNNVGGELIGAITSFTEAFRTANEYGITQIDVYHDYEGVAHWITGRWAARKPATGLYVELVSALKKQYPNIHLVFHHVKGHSGNEYNEIADMIAGGDAYNYQFEILKTVGLMGDE